MKVKVLSIEKDVLELTADFLRVSLLLYMNEYEFKFTVKRDRIGKREIVTFVEDTNFSQIFRLNHEIAMEITKLVTQVYHGDKIKFPVEVEELVTAGQVLN